MKYLTPSLGRLDTIDTFVEQLARQQIPEERFPESLTDSADAIAVDVDTFIAEVTAYLHSAACNDGMRNSMAPWARPLFGLEPIGVSS